MGSIAAVIIGGPLAIVPRLRLRFVLRRLVRRSSLSVPSLRRSPPHRITPRITQRLAPRIAQPVAHLSGWYGVDPAELPAISFSRRAARELKVRLAHAVGRFGF